MLRLAVTLGLAAALGGCHWFAAPATDTAAPAAEAPTEDPAALLPKCRPADAVDTRGEIPFKEGATTASGWTISKVAADNWEFIHVTLTKDGVTTTLEVAFNEGAEGDWATRDYRLMPAPEQEPPEPLLLETIETLRAWQAQQTEPFVEKKKDVIDPYLGLPPCDANGQPT